MVEAPFYEVEEVVAAAEPSPSSWPDFLPSSCVRMAASPPHIPKHLEAHAAEGREETLSPDQEAHAEVGREETLCSCTSLETH